MGDEPLNPVVDLAPAEAEAILRQWLGRAVKCLGLRRLTGGCCCTVVEVALDGPESPVVLKLSDEGGDASLERELAVLRYYREQTAFPVPEPFFCDTSGQLVPYSYLIMERVPGTHLGEARPALSAEDHAAVQRAMGEAVAALHTHTGPHFGLVAGEEVYSDWLQWVHDKLLDLYQEHERLGLLSVDAMARVRGVLDALPALLDAPASPVLVHGDIWATNVMVSEGRLSGFLDPVGRFAHREFELAYLEIWRTADAGFFEAYEADHGRLPGYERRRMVYWLQTLLLHVWLFRTRNYVRATEQLAQQLPL